MDNEVQITTIIVNITKEEKLSVNLCEITIGIIIEQMVTTDTFKYTLRINLMKEIPIIFLKRYNLAIKHN